MTPPAYLVEGQSKLQGGAAGVLPGLGMRAEVIPLLLVQGVFLLLQDGVQSLATRGLVLLMLM